jgi:hypothetical protein
MMSKHFRGARGTIIEILQRDLQLKRFSPRWVLHQLSSSQNNCGDESWFRHEYESDSIFATSAGVVRPRPKAGFQVKKTMITVFFTERRLTILNSLPQGQSFTQDYFISEIVPAFTKEKPRFQRNHPGVTFRCT